jgi:membrane-bound metal-dependent hydrolase YbcI (DUF457 family)
MLLFGHIGITLGIFFVFSYFAPRLKTIIDPRYLAVGALLPDIIDKPVGMIIFASTISNGRMISHTLLFAFTLFLIGLYFYSKKRDIIIITFASGTFFHLMEDQMWNTPATLFWPLLGWSFPKYEFTDGLVFLLLLFKESFIPQFSEGFIPEHTFIPEIIGMIVIVILALNWLKNKLSKISSDNTGTKYEYNEKPEIKTAASYFLGSIIFGFLVVKAIIIL